MIRVTRAQNNPQILPVVPLVLLEHQVLVYSSEFDKLMLVCESITTLMYPFKWPHVYVPILPPSLENFLDAPVPYIMGLLRPTTDLELHKHGSVGILDIDHGKCVSDLLNVIETRFVLPDHFIIKL